MINIKFSYYVDYDYMDFKKDIQDLELNSIMIKYRKTNQKIKMISIPIKHLDDLNLDLKNMIHILHKKQNRKILKDEISNYLFLEQFLNYLNSKLIY